MTQNDDTISRQAAIDLGRDVCNAVMSGCNSHYDSEVGDEVYDDILEVNAILTCNKEVRKALKGMPSAQQDCTDCPEYDTERHFCPRYCETIRRTLEEAQPERTGRWIQHEDSEDTSLAFLTPYHCSECGAVCRDIRDKWCYGCGARMEEPEDIPMEYFESGGR